LALGDRRGIHAVSANSFVCLVFGVFDLIW
jgi:hypothetical protein